MAPVDVFKTGTGLQGDGAPRPTTVNVNPFGIAPVSPADIGMIVVFHAITGYTKEGVLPEPFVFQCPPLESFSPKFGWAWNDYATLGYGPGGGMHSNPQYGQLTTITFSSLFVDAGMVDPQGRIASPSYVVQPYLAGPLRAIRVLKALGSSMTPFAMQAGQPALWGEWEPLGRKGQAAMAVTLRNFEPEERAGEPDARYFSITVSEFPDVPSQSDIAVAPKSMVA